MQVRGRHLVIAWTTVFLVVAAMIVTRTRRGLDGQRRIAELRRQEEALQASRAELVTALAGLRSQRVLGARAEALGLRIASDSELVVIPLPRSR